MCARRASFFARLHFFNCRSRFSAVARVACASAYTSVTGRRLAVNAHALPSRCRSRSGFADVEGVVTAAKDVHEVHDDDDAIVGPMMLEGVALRLARSARSGHSPWPWLAMSEPSARGTRDEGESNGGGGGIRTRVRKYIPAGIYDA